MIEGVSVGVTVGVTAGVISGVTVGDTSGASDGVTEGVASGVTVRVPSRAAEGVGVTEVVSPGSSLLVWDLPQVLNSLPYKKMIQNSTYRYQNLLYRHLPRPN